MTNEELERAVERLTADLTANHAMTLGGAVVRTSDLRLLLSERAELLAAVERMRGEMAGMETRLRRWEPRVSLDLWVASGRPFGAALTTGEATTPNAGERG